jgi:hypothetical protein
MAVTMGQATVPSNSTVQVFILPPGTVNTTLWQPTPASTTVYLGTSVRVSAANGLLLTATPLNSESYVTSRGTPVFATTGNATGTSFMYIISGGG